MSTPQELEQALYDILTEDLEKLTPEQRIKWLRESLAKEEEK